MEHGHDGRVFPFPMGTVPATGQASPGADASGDATLTMDEIAQIRKLLSLLHQAWPGGLPDDPPRTAGTAPAAPPPGPLPGPGGGPPVNPAAGGGDDPPTSSLPPFPPPAGDGGPAPAALSPLPAFPSAPPFPANPAFPAAPAPSAPAPFVVPGAGLPPLVAPPLPAGPGAAAAPPASDPLAPFDALGAHGDEAAVAARLRPLLAELAGGPAFPRVLAAVLGAFPAGDLLRHATPEQALFFLQTLGDRFLQALAGVAFPSRRALLKTVAAWLSQQAGEHSFLVHEGEPFDNQLHERVEGSATGGRTVREMRGFLVVQRQRDRVVRLGRVLT